MNNRQNSQPHTNEFEGSKKSIRINKVYHHYACNQSKVTKLKNNPYTFSKNRTKH